MKCFIYYEGLKNENFNGKNHWHTLVELHGNFQNKYCPSNSGTTEYIKYGDFTSFSYSLDLVPSDYHMYGSFKIFYTKNN